MVCLQPDEEVAVVGFAEVAAEPGAQPARESRDLGHATDDRLDLSDLAAGLGERRAGLGVIVHHKATLVDRRHEAGRDMDRRVGTEGEDRQQEHDRHDRSAQEQVEQRRVRAGVEAGVFAGHLRLQPVEPDDRAGEHWNDERGHQVGDDQRAAHRHGERLRERASDAAEEAERYKYDQCGQARAGQRHHELACGRHHRCRANRRAVIGIREARRCTVRDMLDHDDHVVDEQTNGGSDAAERHDVEAELQHRQQEDGHCKRRRHDDQRDEREPQAAQKTEQDEPGEAEADDHGVAHAGRRLHDELALVVPVLQGDPCGQGEPGERRLDVGGDLHGVAVGLLVDVEEHRRPAILDDA